MLDEATLRRLYLEEQRSIRAIATREGIAAQSVHDALVRYEIPRRTSGFATLSRKAKHNQLDETTLRRLYIEERLTIRAIADLSNVSTRIVYDALSRYRIPRRVRGYRAEPANAIEVEGGWLDKLTLQRLYINEGRPIAEIAATVRSSPSRIRNALVRWDIPRRRRGRRNRGRTFDED